MNELLLVGEAPNRQGKGRLANTTPTGARIAALGGGHLPRTNLLQTYPGSDGKGAAFPIDLARIAVRRVERRHPKRVAFLLMGKRVGRAFGLDGKSRPEYLTWYEVRGREVAVVPHPSGINQWWNSPENREAAASFFRSLLV